MSRPRRVARSVEEGVVLAFFELAGRLNRLVDGIATAGGLTAQQWLMLLQVAGDPNFGDACRSRARNGDPLSATQIAAARGVSRATISGLVSELMRKGFLRQTPDTGDRRRKNLELTAAGARALAAIESERRRTNRMLLADLDGGQRAELLSALQSCLSRLTDIDGPEPHAGAAAPQVAGAGR